MQHLAHAFEQGLLFYGNSREECSENTDWENVEG